ncbi:hypothetical protein AB9N12_10805 [Bacteroides sp. AN502(2024)]|uniref:hypothetical protein n=1 Tax=Bacteroides sp. AN502(2024) TaxID=3160599 RepID=UPI00351272D4
MNTVLENDIPAVERLEYETILKTKRLMVILEEIVPFTLNITTLCSTLGVSCNQLMRLLALLERSALIRQLFTEAKGLKQLVKPEKILFDNPNLMHALNPQAETGTIRESFFASMLAAKHRILAAKEGTCLRLAAREKASNKYAIYPTVLWLPMKLKSGTAIKYRCGCLDYCINVEEDEQRILLVLHSTISPE